MSMYRLKSEAVPFFEEKLATLIHPLSFWEDLCVDKKALEEVGDAYITYGHKASDIYTSLSGWNKEDGSKFLFTIHFPSVKFGEHDRFSKGRVVRKFMDEIQSRINRFYSEFVNEGEESNG